MLFTMTSLSNTYAQDLGKTLHDSHDFFKEKTMMNILLNVILCILATFGGMTLAKI
jgi:fluoride ion exporter CrcB/FEX